MITGADLKVTPDPTLEHLTPVCAYCIPPADLQHLSLTYRLTFGICDSCRACFDDLAGILHPRQKDHS